MSRVETLRARLVQYLLNRLYQQLAVTLLQVGPAETTVLEYQVSRKEHFPAGNPVAEVVFDVARGVQRDNLEPAGLEPFAVPKFSGLDGEPLRVEAVHVRIETFHQLLEVSDVVVVRVSYQNCLEILYLIQLLAYLGALARVHQHLVEPVDVACELGDVPGKVIYFHREWIPAVRLKQVSIPYNSMVEVFTGAFILVFAFGVLAATVMLAGQILATYNAYVRDDLSTEQKLVFVVLFWLVPFMWLVYFLLGTEKTSTLMDDMEFL